MQINFSNAKLTQSIYEKSVILYTRCVPKPLVPIINNVVNKIINALGFTAINIEQKDCCYAMKLHNGDNSSTIKQN